MQAARKLQRRKGRTAARAFLIEGLTLLQDALDAGADVAEVFIEDCSDRPEAEELCLAHELTFYRIDRQVGRVLAQTVTAPGVVAVVRFPDIALADISMEADLVLVVAEVRDPGNAGTLVRSAAAAGAGAVIFSTRAVDPLAPKTVRSGAGAIFRIPLVLEAELEGATAFLRRRGFVVAAADAHAGLIPERCDMTRPMAFVVGNEARGLPEGIEGSVDEVIGIPMPGSAESLNVGVAGSILLFEAVRQRRASSQAR
ncbi:MAG: methyltransferase, TrmH family [Actinomycetota bacterium]|nr:methyltransferase, TrmH family [Actinomycetota bacterium]